MKYTFCCASLLLFCTIFQLEAVSSNIPKSRMRRLVNAQAAPIRKYPWHIQLIRGGQFICGGSIISKQWVLTAAHCVLKGINTDYTIIVSSVHLLEKNKYKVKQIKVHEEYDRKEIINDIAVLEIEGEFTFDKYTSAVKLVERDVELKGRTLVRISGHGLDENAKLTELLKEELLVTLTNKECQQIYGKSEVPDTALCAGYPFEVKTTCQGDSGGPLVTDKDNIQVGIVSWGYGCKNILPKVFTKVSKFREWITNNTGI